MVIYIENPIRAFKGDKKNSVNKKFIIVFIDWVDNKNMYLFLVKRHEPVFTDAIQSQKWYHKSVQMPLFMVTDDITMH